MFMNRICLVIGLLPTLVSAQSVVDAVVDAGAEAATELAPISVEADPFAGRSPLETTQPTEVLSSEELDRARAQTLGDSLQSLPGVQSAEFGAGSSRPVIRGQGGPRVRILDGGSGVIDASTISPDHNAAVEPFRAQQIEVLKGPATLLYGSGAIGGVVNVVSDMFPAEAIEGVAGGLGGSFSSVDSGKSVFGHLEGGRGGFVFHLDGLTRETEDYDIPGVAIREVENNPEAHEGGLDEVSGPVTNTATETDSYALGLSWVTEAFSVGVGASTYDSIYGVPGHAHEDAVATSEPDANPSEGEIYIDLEQRRYELRAGMTKPWGWLQRARGSLVFSEYEHAEIEGAGEVGTIFRNEGTELRVELTHTPLSAWTGVFGLHGFTQEFSAVGEEAFVPPVDTDNMGAFWIEEREFGTGRLSMGLRAERVEITARGDLTDRDFDLFSVSAGWHQDLTEHHHLNLNVSHAERAPDVVELYSNGPHLATLTDESGNLDLKKEQSLNFDLGHAGESGDWFFGLDLFYTLYNDYIFAEEYEHAEEPAGDSVHAGELTAIAYRQTDADFWGGELQLGYRVDEQHQIMLFGDTVRARRDSGDKLPRIPADRLGLRFDGAYRDIAYGLRLVQVFDQGRVTEHEGPTEGYLLLGADVSYLLALGGSEVVFALRGRNLLDESARNHTSFLKNQAPLAGANAQLDVEWIF